MVFELAFSHMFNEGYFILVTKDYGQNYVKIVIGGEKAHNSSFLHAWFNP
jgi:hypothetical protein